ncbi:MAG: PQQ-binding-like beta-propeller repeat protein [Ferruginibacter sp.]
MPVIRLKYVPFIVILSVLFSCNKPGTVTDNPPGEGKKLFIDLWGAEKNSTAFFPVNSFRIAYDYVNKKLLWKKSNDNIEALDKLVEEFSFYRPQVPFTESFVAGNSLIRIFADRTVNTSGAYMHSPNRNGVYLEKIDKFTGERTAFINIIPASALIAGYIAFDISRVVYDGTNFYFGCADGKLYCYTADGVQVWSKPNYLPKLHDNKVSLIYVNNGRLYYVGGNKKINSINTADGSQVWQIGFNSDVIENQNHCELSFSNTKMFAFTNFDVQRYSLATGQFEGFCESYGAEKITSLPVTLQDTLGFAFNTVENSPLVCETVGKEVGTNILLQYINAPCLINGDCKLYKQSFYGWGFNEAQRADPNSQMEFASLSYNTGLLKWSKKYAYSVEGGFPQVFNYFLDDNKVYIICNFYFKNDKIYQYAPTEKGVLTRMGYVDYGNTVGLVELDAATGAVLSQDKIFSDDNFGVSYCYRFSAE